ncbi:hypothetical protein QR680_013000 [Steinernema hermaphroditum]|uniref:Uncharacterized protein n=1 Tax=Steinernema hermaphroditum TaxID=289476 RepID=A0AA39M1T4_9BILA|nr:hypothetical protein QR680_013000 [Steinernema hermaphroditum]
MDSSCAPCKAIAKAVSRRTKKMLRASGKKAKTPVTMGMVSILVQESEGLLAQERGVSRPHAKAIVIHRLSGSSRSGDGGVCDGEMTNMP